MKKIIALLLAIVLVAACFCGCDKEEKETIVVGYTNYAPMNYVDDNGELVGFDTELAKTVFESLGYEVIFQLIDWPSKYTDLNSGAIDCVWNGFTANTSDDDGIARAQKVDFSYNCMENRQVIVAKSGSGKTTLLRCLNFLESLDEGQIFVNGKPLLPENERLSDEQIRKNRLHFGLVFQNFNLFPQYTSLQNVTLAPNLLKADTPEMIEKNALQLLEHVGLSDKLSNYPHQLSGGQQQRVAIARALALQPDILCFDELTSALDPELTGEVLRVIRGLKNIDRTMIVVTHEMEFAKNVADVVIYMADGNIEEIGTPEQIFNHPVSAKTRAFLQNAQNIY